MKLLSDVHSAALQKCTKDDVAGLQGFTIRRMDEKLPVGSDIAHYKLLKIQDNALDSRLHFLNTLCFPTLFSTARYGQFHPHEGTFVHHATKCLGYQTILVLKEK